MRKDVECTFNFIKGRFRIFQYGFRFHSISKCDQLWLTCLALHNMLLSIDGLDENWGQGVHQDYVHTENIDTPLAIQKINRHAFDKIRDSFNECSMSARI